MKRRLGYVLEAKSPEMTTTYYPRWTGDRWDTVYYCAKVFATKEGAEAEAVVAALKDPRAIGTIVVVEVPAMLYSGDL